MSSQIQSVQLGVSLTSPKTKKLPPANGKTKVGMVQVNNSFDQQSYLPLSIGFLHSYAQAHAENFDDFQFLTPIYKRIPVDQAVQQLKGAELVAFSTYVWNFEISKAIARRLKKENPDTVIAFGGCHVPDTREKGLEAFVREHDFIDMASMGEGELVFKSLLENLPNRNWRAVPSLAYINNGDFVQTPPVSRIEDLNQVPSPYLSGFFNPLMEQNPEEGWIGLFETNRGCPFRCSFCDWGINSRNRMANYDLEERIFPEIDWFSKNEVEFVYCCDANFGMYSGRQFQDRDLRIAQRFAENKQKYGFPHRFSVQNTKNSTDESYKIQRVLNDSGLDKGVLLAFQSLHEPTLEAIDRKNIKLKTFFDLQKRFTSDGISTFSDIILGLPLETYDTFTAGVSKLIEMGQHNRIQFNNFSILPNAPASDPEYRKKYGIQSTTSDLINIHGSLDEWTDDIYERQDLVVGTNSMPPEDWVKTRNFGYMTALLHFDKLLQMTNIVLHTQYGTQYNDIIDRFVNTADPQKPIITEVSRFLSQQALDLQNGGAEYIHSENWLNIWWPADELALINLATQNNLNGFYREAHDTLDSLLKEQGNTSHQDLLDETLRFNQALLKMPRQSDDLKFNSKYNLWEVYKSAQVSESMPLQKGNYSYVIDRTSDTWGSWEDWARKVIWWGNKKGDYMYPCKPLYKSNEIAAA